MPRSIVVVGSLNLDLVAHVDRHAEPGETVAARSFDRFIGGKGANQAGACARLGAAVSLIGRVGSDEFGEQLVGGLSAVGVNTEAVERVAGASGVALITVDNLAQNSITVVGGANSQLTPDEVDRHAGLIREASIVLAQLEIPIDAVRKVAEIAQRAAVPFILDPAPAMALPQELLRRVTWLTPNETESRSLLGGGYVNEVAEIARRILEKGCRNVVLKLGAAGVYMAGADTASLHVDGFAVEAVDSTAAGDAFNGAFAVALAEGAEPAEAARFACAAAAVSVTRHGAMSSMATREEVLSLLGRGEIGCAQLS